MKHKDISGNTYNFWTAISFSHKAGQNQMYNCVCVCGKQKLVSRRNLHFNRTTSCGCMHSERCKKHGLSKSSEFYSWCAMKNRCKNPKNPNYVWYGARGIKVCEEWENSFEQFLKDMGRKPTLKHSIDRIDNSLGYNKENCRWVTISVQSRNKRNNISYIINGERLCIADLAKKFNLSEQGIKSRLDKGYDISDAILSTSDFKAKFFINGKYRRVTNE